MVIDDYRAAFEMTEHLINAGHKRIGFIKGDWNQEVSHARFKGYRDAMHKYKINLSDTWVDEGNFEFEASMKAAEKLLKKSRLTAIFASSDDMAAGVMAAAHKLKLNLPED